MNPIITTFQPLAARLFQRIALGITLTLLSGTGYTLSAQQLFHNWSHTYNGSVWTYTSSSPAGQISASTKSFPPASSGLSLPPITNTTITQGFNPSKVGAPIDFDFSPGYGWGKGGQMIIGNIHNYFEYTISAWDQSGAPMDVNQWNTIADYPLGWSPASKTNRTAAGNSSKFWVYDPSSSSGSGQGGVLWLGGLKNVARIRLSLTNNNLAPNGQGSDFIVFNVATPNEWIRDHCSKPATDFNNKPVSAWWDTANCYLKPVVSGATPFIWNNMHYVTADKSTQCVTGAGSWDGANCYYMPKPSGGFIQNDTLYVPAGFGNSCSLGVFDGVACNVKSAPWGTHAFEWSGNWYFTSLYTCKDGSYDGANCYVMRPPPGTVAFIYANNYYYAE